MPSFSRVALRPRQMLHVSKTPMKRIYFVERGLVSVSASTGQNGGAEVWLVGREGMTGIPILLQDPEPPLNRVVQIGGEGLAIDCDQLRVATADNPAFRAILMRYVEFVLLQAAQEGACNAHHDLEQRLSRWLLLARDAAGCDELPLTHNTLSRLLGVRRASVTNCLGVLQKEASIVVCRGSIIVSDVLKLNDICCDCYRFIGSEYERLIENRAR